MTAGFRPDEVAQFRQAARTLLRHRGLEERSEALRRLMKRAIAERNELAAGAITAEVEWSIDRHDVESTRHAGEPLERRHRALRARGLEACPTCASPLSAPADWRRWAELREAAIAARRREGAVA
jgi:hypothetical protein